MLLNISIAMSLGSNVEVFEMNPIHAQFDYANGHGYQWQPNNHQIDQEQYCNDGQHQNEADISLLKREMKRTRILLVGIGIAFLLLVGLSFILSVVAISQQNRASLTNLAYKVDRLNDSQQTVSNAGKYKYCAINFKPVNKLWDTPGQN